MFARKFVNNQPFRESTSDELEKREGAGTLFVQPIITRCGLQPVHTSCWPEANYSFCLCLMRFLLKNPLGFQIILMSAKSHGRSLPGLTQHTHVLYEGWDVVRSRKKGVRGRFMDSRAGSETSLFVFDLFR